MLNSMYEFKQEMKTPMSEVPEQNYRRRKNIYAKIAVRFDLTKSLLKGTA